MRASSIDELPELWNVLRGDMSLVGPRPLLTEYLGSYSPRQRRRHQVRPGITSWAAVNGRHSLKFEERLELDVWYVEHRTLRLDLRILLVTIKQVLGRSDVTVTQSLTDIGFPPPQQTPAGTPQPGGIDELSGHGPSGESVRQAD
jgi:lipopolysaccharide/colanic/teichoic acid biosynthesis glycosyltransferase